MSKFIKNIKRNPIIRFCASVKIAVICLLFLFFLTFWGTIAQVDQGLYLAQQKYFNSLFFLIWNFIPFPGAQLVMWVLFINLCCASITRFVFKWSYFGILITHFGLILYFISAFAIFQLSEESNLTLLPGETKNVSSGYHQWEVSIWKSDSPQKRKVIAISENILKNGKTIRLEELHTNIFIKSYYQNSQAYTAGPTENIISAINHSGIQFLEPVKFNIEPEKNIPGGIFTVTKDNFESVNVLLYGGEGAANEITLGEKKISIQLRRKKFELPILMTLNKFQKEFYPGTQTPKSFRSFATVNHNNVKRDIEIFMNHPFRFKNYTFYQASYGVDSLGREFSTLAVVKNAGRILPYIASGVTFIGLLVHFLMMAFPRRKNEKTN